MGIIEELRLGEDKMLNDTALSLRKGLKKKAQKSTGKQEVYSGLSDVEVRERVKSGRVNKSKNATSKSVKDIIRSNVFTLFNAINLILLILVLLAGSPKNGLFAGVIITNSLVGIVQELRAKRIVERISVLNAITVTVIRNGIRKEINVDEVVVDDIIFLGEGQQVVVDSELLTGDYIELDESLLTGESDAMKKEKGDMIFAGSLVLGGGGYVRAKMVGDDTYAAKLAKEAKKFKLAKSELQLVTDKILKLTIKFIIPIGILLIVTQIINTSKDWRQASVSAISGIVGMIPEGLVLLITAAFMVSVIRLSKWKTLVQELPATEILARVDTLCLDKTGTITEGKLKLEEIVPLSSYNLEEIEEVLGSLSKSFVTSNSTLKAIKEKYESYKAMEVKKTIPFNSTRKWSGVEFSTGEKWVIGAPEVILRDSYDRLKDQIEVEAKKGRRVLILAKINSGELADELPKDMEGVALVLFEDIIRKDAAETLGYFNKQKVDIKIISGDNAVTVSSVAEKAGVKNAENYVDARYLPEDEEELLKVVRETTVFGRTTPHQKKAIVKALHRDGKTVAMTGDGVNDVLALKEADCGIAMASGSDATKAVAQLVLLESNFNALPHVVAEGRRTINNIEKVSNLYLSKMVYSIIMSIVFCLLLLPYPIMPIQLTLIGTVGIGIPSFFLAMEPNENIVKEGFLKRLLEETVPNGIVIAISTIIIFLSAYYNNLSIEQARTLTLMVMGGISLIVLIKVSMPYTKFKALLSGTIIGIFILSFIIPISRKFFIIYAVDFYYLAMALALIALSPLMMRFTKVIMKKPLDKYFNKRIH
ncbi:HAD-IC family P-type ATPase [Clostridium amazonitimonense]|uniref:HAD-IC family P-type ATPase n=1 Tax=Clostridium amazonitimonense TaxID=1499689 RepID=UPI000ADCFF1F|nr:HAD-IC family P-type ATPase [Clostridium amazonitimonense]